MSFEVKHCEKCGAEEWVYRLEGKLVLNQRRIYVNDTHHDIPLWEFIKSYGFKDGDRINIYFERKENK